MDYQDLIDKLEACILFNESSNIFIDAPSISGKYFIEKIEMLKRVSENVYLCFNSSKVIVGIFDFSLKKIIPCHYTSYIETNGVLVLKCFKGDPRPSLIQSNFERLEKIYLSLYNLKTGEYITGTEYYSEIFHNYKKKGSESSYAKNGYYQKDGLIFLGFDNDKARLIYDTVTNKKYVNYKFYGIENNIIKLYDSNYKIGEKIIAVFDLKTRKIYELTSLSNKGLASIFKEFYYYIVNNEIRYLHSIYKTEFKKCENFNIIYIENEDNEITMTIIFDDDYKFVKKYLGNFKEIEKKKVNGREYPTYLYENELYIFNPQIIKSKTFPFVKISKNKDKYVIEKNNLEENEAIKSFELEKKYETINGTYILKNEDKIIGFYDINNKIFQRIECDDWFLKENFLFFKKVDDNAFKYSFYDLKKQKFYENVLETESDIEVYKENDFIFIKESEFKSKIVIYDCFNSILYNDYDKYEKRDFLIFLYKREDLKAILNIDNHELKKCYKLPIKSHYTYKLEHLYLEMNSLNLVQPYTNFDYYYEKIGDYNALILKVNNDIFATIIFDDELSFSTVFLGKIIEISNDKINKEDKKIFYIKEFNKFCYLDLKDDKSKNYDDNEIDIRPFIEIPNFLSYLKSQDDKLKKLK